MGSGGVGLGVFWYVVHVREALRQLPPLTSTSSSSPSTLFDYFLLISFTSARLCRAPFMYDWTLISTISPEVRSHRLHLPAGDCWRFVAKLPPEFHKKCPQNGGHHPRNLHPLPASTFPRLQQCPNGLTANFLLDLNAINSEDK